MKGATYKQIDMAHLHSRFSVRVLVVLSALLGVYCQSSGCPGCSNTTVCIDSQCLPRCISSKPSGECEQCQESLYGKQCENECPKDCSDSRCHLGNNSHVVCTDECVAGRRGGKCTVPCPNNCRHCDRYGDDCISCKQGYYGVDCDGVCSENCDGPCNFTTGQCSKCKLGYRGRRCTVKCPVQCGSDCSLSLCQCVHGYTGAGCDEMCSPNCDDDCDRDTGQCSECKPGYRGKNCSEPCPEECSTCQTQIPNCTGCFSSAQCMEGHHHDPGNDFLITNVGIGLTVVATTGFVLLVAFILWKRMSRRTKIEKENMDGTLENDSIKLTEIPLQEFTTTNPTYMLSGGDIQQVKYCEHFKGKDKRERIEDEFQKLPSPDSRETRCASMESNASKNRYKDVLPFDDTRVSLEVWEDGTTDYINASFITGYRNQIQYVAAQGPNIHVVEDFWRMVWQQNTTKIVMLTNLVEAGKIKCEMYWPFCSSDYQRYGRVCVQCVEEKVYQHHTLRTLAVWKDSAKTRNVLQFHFTSWPDHGVPDEKSIIDFHRVVKNTGYNALGPLVIHCSAGVGRSGTFIALDFLLDQARYEGRVCIFNCIQQFRLQRMKMVQTKDQYTFLYDILVKALQYRGTLPRYYAPVVIECPNCWDQKIENSQEDEFTLEENHIEYQPLWNCGLAKRETYRPRSAQVQPEACAIISENSPPLTSEIAMDTETESHADDLEKQRISWDTAM